MGLNTCFTDDACTHPRPCPVLRSGAFLLCRWHMLIVWWGSVVTTSKATLETHLCSPPKQHLPTTEMKAIDNRGIPTAVRPCGELTVNTGGRKALPTLWRLSVEGACYLSGISLVPWATELLLRRNQVVNTCLAFQKFTGGCPIPTTVQRLPGKVAGLCDPWPFERPPWFLFCSEAKLDCWACLPPPRIGEGGSLVSAQIKCTREKPVLNESAIHQANIILFKLHCAILSWPATKWNSL